MKTLITVRFVHFESHTPILELEAVDASCTLSKLKALLVNRFISEEFCMMRMFVKWHAKMQVGEKSRYLELADADDAQSLQSLGIGDYTEVLLEGPMTGDNVEGVGRIAALLSTQVQQQREDISHLKNAVTQLTEGQTFLLKQVAELRIKQLSSEMHQSQRETMSQEHAAFQQLFLLMAEEGYLNIYLEALKAHQALSRDEQKWCLVKPSVKPNSYSISADLTTACKTINGPSTVRFSRPINHNSTSWNVRIDEDMDANRYMVLGLLPKHSAQLEGEADSNWIRTLNGWGMYGDASVFGSWQCAKGGFTFRKGDIIRFAFNFAEKKLTIRCGTQKAEAKMPNFKLGDELYPAASFFYIGQKVTFITN
eukprot:GILI01016858.1.p1 GENE.GILI01016858.1~~GILI01016858.1.p1  ORF type:complete len:367 (-),score=44.40 GILI01016858.1:129-1229(-)